MDTVCHLWDNSNLRLCKLLLLLCLVCTCDVIVLIIAMKRRKRHAKLSPKTSSIQISGGKSSFVNHGKWSPKTPTIKISGNSYIKNKSLDLPDLDDFERGLESPNIGRSTNDLDIMDDLKLTIRCLSLTTFYFVSQLCTFVPGMIFFNEVNSK